MWFNPKILTEPQSKDLVSIRGKILRREKIFIFKAGSPLFDQATNGPFDWVLDCATTPDL